MAHPERKLAPVNVAASAAPTAIDSAIDSVETGAVLAPAMVSNKDKPASETRKRTSFDMSQVDRIQLRVWGYADLTGEYSIDPDNSISLPRIGRVEVAGLKPAELEELLVERIGALARSDVSVSVEATRFRPYYISGLVARSGAIEWRPGLKVIQAISLAGGIWRSTSGSSGGQLPISGASRHQAQTQLTFALTQLARLKAEKEGVSAVETSARVAALLDTAPPSSREALATVMARQNGMLAELQSMEKSQIEGLQKERESAARELEAAEVQRKAMEDQLELTRTMLRDIENLKDQKLVTKNRYLTQRTDLLTSEVRYAEARSLIARATARLASLDQQILAVPQRRRTALNERIETLEREAAQLEITLSEPGQSAASDMLKLEYHIARDGDGGVQTTAATLFTEVRPGDVIIVSGADEPRGMSVTTAQLGGDPVASTQQLIEASAIVHQPSSGVSSRPGTQGPVGAP